MRKINLILSTLLICCCADCFAQGRVTREKKEKKEKTEHRQDPPKRKNTETPPSQPPTPSKPMSGQINGFEWVDLGLQSGLKWATCNVGASSPAGYGDYFAWGETSIKSSYDESNSLTRGKTGAELESEGIIDSRGDTRGRLNRNYDAACANWGGSWRMPAKEEFDELLRECEWEWTSYKGKMGYKVTGPNGNFIFLPAAGRRYGSSLNNAGEYGYYWSWAVGDGTDGACGLLFYSGSHLTDRYYRCYGRSVRPVSE